MPDTLSVPRVRAFLTRLEAENDRAWFKAHQGEYEADLKAPAEALLDRLRAPLREMTGLEATPKLFRPQRDLRFSKNKRPYHLHLHLMWSLAAGGASEPACFLGIDLKGVTVGLGCMAMNREQLERWRSLLLTDTARMAALIERAEAGGFTFREGELKRTPGPCPPDHPLARFARMKSCVATKEMAESGPLEPRLMEAFRQGLPVLEMLHPVL
ncbi:DUF2461 domain-containing protein [Pseudoroseicyclus sp. CXY001]|uniref:DUF2461 domain-containing protein n=1 Tax=Pseudoroseicyclus sp. CXY001 TaxID=3242492 RepID=UPI00357170D2